MAYALGRTLIVSDDLLVEEMMEKLKQNNNRVRVALEHLIQSPSFSNKSGSPRLPSSRSRQTLDRFPNHRTKATRNMNTEDSRMKNLTRRRWLHGAVSWQVCLGWNQFQSGDKTMMPRAKHRSPSGLAFCSWHAVSHPNHWWAKGQGNEMELSRCLQPLDSLKSKLNVINGLLQ